MLGLVAAGSFATCSNHSVDLIMIERAGTRSKADTILRNQVILLSSKNRLYLLGFFQLFGQRGHLRSNLDGTPTFSTRMGGLFVRVVRKLFDAGLGINVLRQFFQFALRLTKVDTEHTK